MLTQKQVRAFKARLLTKNRKRLKEAREQLKIDPKSNIAKGRVKHYALAIAMTKHSMRKFP